MNSSHWSVIFLKFGVVLFLAIILLPGGRPRAETADDLFSQGVKAYENGEYQLSIDKLSEAISLLEEDGKRIEAFKTMAFAYMAFLKREDATRQFCNILKLDPAFELDPIMTPPKILAVFREAKERCLPFGGIQVQAASREHETITGAKVYLNGKLIGETPLQRKDILPGQYELEVRKDGFRSFKAGISVEERVMLEVKSTLIRGKVPTVSSIVHDITAPLLPGDMIAVTLMGDSGNAATFDLGDFKKGLPMKEVSPGRYVGIYQIGEEDRFSNQAIVGNLEDRHGFRASKKVTGPVSTNVLSRSELYLQRGKASMEKGEYDLAIDSLSRALYENPNFVQAHILLAKAYSKKKGAYLESVKYLKNALELAPNNLEACALLAQIYMENGKYEDAFPVVKKILGMVPDSGLAYGCMGEILSYRGRYREAIEALRKSLQLEGRDPRIYFLLGKAFERCDRLADAVLEYEMAVELSPTTYQYRNDLAACYRSLGQEMSAFRNWEKCLESVDLTELERREVKRRLSELSK